jgi:hypothetical protein
MTVVIRKNLVAQALFRLRNQKIHPLFAGYLYLQQRSGELGRLDNLQPEFLSFYKKFFSVSDHPLGTPYIKPFTEQKPSNQNLWLNVNVAGSYAPSSLRPDQPFRQVVDIQGKIYSLPDDHAIRALQHLLYSQSVQIIDLAIFFYRDYGFINDKMTAEELMQVFMYEFGYSDEFNKPQNNASEILFLFDLDEIPTSDLFELI